MKTSKAKGRSRARVGSTGGSAHRCARIRRGLYNYRAYNVRRFPRGWAVRDEDGKPYGPITKTLRGICGLIDVWERTRATEEDEDGHCPSRNQGRDD